MAEHLEQSVLQASAVAIAGRALLIEGPPGSGKSSLALALIDRGAQLIGDDAVTLSRQDTVAEPRLLASAPPNIVGLIEVRGVGLARLPIAPPAPVALILTIADDAARLPDAATMRTVLGCSVPTLAFVPGSFAPARRAEIALQMHGLTFE